MSKVALHLREHDLPAEVFDFQAGRDGLSDELVVRLDFFIWCFYQYFSMLVAEAHKRLCLAGHLTDRQPTIVQRLAHIQEDNGVYYVAEYLSSDRISGPFGQQQKTEILLACLDDALDIRPAKVFGKQINGLQFLVGKKNEVSEAHGHPVFLFVLQGGVLLRMIKHVVAFPLKGVVLVHIHIGKDFLAEEFDLLPLAEVDVSAADKAVLPFVQTGLELVVESLERKALPGWHPADESLLSAVMESVYHFFGDVSGVQNKRVDCYVKTYGDIVHHCHYGADVKHVAGDDIVPYREAGLLVKHEDESGLSGRGIDSMAAESIEGIVVDIVGKGRGVHITTLPEVRIGLAHPFHKGLEEREPDAVLAHHGEVCSIATERCRGYIPENIRGKRLLDKVVTTYAAPITENTVQDVAQNSFALNFIRKGCLQDFRHPDLCKEAKQQMCIAEDSVDFSIGENVNATAGQPLISAGNLVKSVGNGIVGDKTPLGRKEYAGFAVRSEPDNFTESLTHNLSGMELAPILDVLRFLDSSAAAENISVSVPHQFLNSNKCHARMSYSVVLSSTANLRNIPDNSKHFSVILLKINHLVIAVLRPSRCSATFALS